MASPPLLHHLTISILLLLIHPSPATAQTYHNITLGSSLSPLAPNTSWLSPSGDFAFGFHPLETNPKLFLLAIWFDKIPNKTVVWYPTGINPVQAGSKVELTSDGRLSLRDQTGKEVWTSETTNADHAAMLDTGNFMLVKADSSVLWQSFEKPSDTILPTQVLTLGTQLSSRLMDTDYSTGRFQLAVQTDGDLVFYPVAIPTGFRYDSYWSSNTVGSGTQLVFNESGTVYFAQNDGTQVILTSASIGSIGDFYQRATLDPDGVFRQYIYPKNGTGDWYAVGYLPLDICRAITTGTGSGACGFNSYCKLDVKQRPNCECPPQYSFLDPTRKYKGCKPDFAAQSCEPGGEALFEFIEMENVDWPLSDYEHFNPVDEEQCRENCLGDCFCAVVIFYRNGDCWKKKIPLSNGKMGSYVDRKALIKVSKGVNSSSQAQPMNTIREKKD